MSEPSHQLPGTGAGSRRKRGSRMSKIVEAEVRSSLPEIGLLQSPVPCRVDGCPAHRLPFDANEDQVRFIASGERAQLIGDQTTYVRRFAVGAPS